MLINKKVKNEEVAVGDLFLVKSSDLNNQHMENRFIGFSPKNEGIENIYINISFAKNMLNIVGVNIFFEKEKGIVSEQYHESPVFINYLLSSLDNIKKIKNNEIPHYIKIDNIASQNNDLNINNMNLGVSDINGNKLNYGDILKLDYDKLKDFISNSFNNLLETKNVKEVYIHLLDLNKDKNAIESLKYMTSLAYTIYAISDNGFENSFDKEHNEYSNKKYKQTGDDKYKMPNEIHYDFTNPGFVRTLAKNNIIVEIVGSSPNEHLEIEDIKPQVRKNRYKI